MQFNVHEIFQMAEQIERNGARFYRLAAELSVDPRTRELLLSLAAMEDDHERTFAALREQLASAERRQALCEPDDQVAQYLWAWADHEVFDVGLAPDQVLGGDESAEEVLRLAIAREKESIVFYEGLKGALVEEAQRAKVEAIIREELGHIAQLIQRRHDLEPQ